ncbi:hypothetical protein L1987_39080 [Smallanthus sonchifolius]|uniref:Uncharacterized protein n=1 Tax=Smallanthus sonchifolius TaxID=185202 RepID=A0ACB9HL04_9ASTR|nr:hypothetical protein L1987_39080 [Smallanthus sonchifolius]
MIGEQFDYGDDICGAVVNVRAKQEKISFWTKNVLVQTPFLTSFFTEINKESEVGKIMATYNGDDKNLKAITVDKRSISDVAVSVPATTVAKLPPPLPPLPHTVTSPPPTSVIGTAPPPPLPPLPHISDPATAPPLALPPPSPPTVTLATTCTAITKSSSVVACYDAAACSDIACYGAAACSAFVCSATATSNSSSAAACCQSNLSSAISKPSSAVACYGSAACSADVCSATAGRCLGGANSFFLIPSRFCSSMVTQQHSIESVLCQLWILQSVVAENNTEINKRLAAIEAELVAL